MNAFKRWLRRWLQEEDRVEKCIEAYPSNTLGRAKNSIASDSDYGAVNFRVYSARGGKIVEANHYDPKTDRGTNSLYVIDDDADFTEEIGKIITMESMR